MFGAGTTAAPGGPPPACDRRAAARPGTVLAPGTGPVDRGEETVRHSPPTSRSAVGQRTPDVPNPAVRPPGLAHVPSSARQRRALLPVNVGSPRYGSRMPGRVPGGRRSGGRPGVRGPERRSTAGEAAHRTARFLSRGRDDPDQPSPRHDDRREHRPFRVVPGVLWSVENNINLANMDWEEFAARSRVPERSSHAPSPGPAGEPPRDRPDWRCGRCHDRTRARGGSLLPCATSRTAWIRLGVGVTVTGSWSTPREFAPAPEEVVRGTLFRALLAASTAPVLGAGAANATPLASAYTGTGGPVPALGCASSHLGGDLDIAARTAPSSHPRWT